MTILDSYIRNLETNECSAETIKTYTRTANQLQAYVCGNFDGASFERDTVRGYMIDAWANTIKDLKPTTRRLYYIAAYKFLAYLYNAQIISFDLTPMVPKPQSLEKMYRLHPEDRPDKSAYTIAQVQTMLETSLRTRESTLRTHAMIAVLVATGLRLFECLQLNAGDLQAGAANVARKGTHGNLVSVVIPGGVSKFTDPYLEYRRMKGELLNADSPLFTSRDGERLSKREAQRSISSIEEKLGYPTGVHTFRHTALTMASKLADPATARDIAGQKNISVTNRYLHSTEEEKRATTERMADVFLTGSDERANTEISAALQADSRREKLMAELLRRGHSAETAAEMAEVMLEMM